LAADPGAKAARCVLGSQYGPILLNFQDSRVSYTGSIQQTIPN
jgi:hypothetical protein